MEKKLNFSKMFMDMHPGFFEKEYIKNIGDGREYKELILWASDIEKTNIPIEVPDNITFGMYEGDFEAFLSEVRRVDTGWAEIYKPGDRIYCGFDGEKIASFCMLEDMGTWIKDSLKFNNGEVEEYFYGGKFVENFIQGTARDLLATALVRLDCMGLKPILHVHDEIVIETPTKDVERNKNILRLCMVKPPAWFEKEYSFLLDTEMSEQGRYSK